MTDAATIVFIAHTGQVSGAEKVLLNLVDEAETAGHRAVVACPTGRLSESLPDGVRHIAIPELSLGGERGLARGVAACRLVGRWLAAGRSVRPIVRSPGTSTVVNSLFALPVARVAGPKRGASWLVHDTMTSAKQKAVVALSKPAIRVAVSVSEATAVPLKAAGVPTVVSHNGVRWPVEQYGGDLHDPPVVGMVALLTPWKGHTVLLDAVASLPGVRLELAGGSFPGDAAYVEELKRRAAQADLAGRVEFLGHTDTDAALRRWDVAVSASTSPEAGPLSVLEAMSHGLPVVGTDHGGTTEFLTGGAGVLVEPGNSAALATAIEGVLADGSMRRRLGETARRRVEAEHDLAVTLPQLLKRLTE
ncbi:glycosyltransferase family 4 protein [Rhodococcus sp. BP-252]|uniref:Glycosyltransferase n=1 Tax=Rhodococcoides kyotonense TaxID=398843 RepID=A0A177YMY6_9NOCA|nr:MULTISPECIES: glycosyltransferase family 4 protein [Rhodococcus]MBY6412161.1 glycosyltransferase family 4 protein [Rhodococcus sp. BP-320]MBY6416741.1 glycosyltransferase family 4 protein [Rhodococcus sp. BP-321]MBY6421070.1 glycosyltransferase family 4 protein [Rhodococcus sp. BP-324]MBY6426765.1 glycosyltransferase family 4 protein [Rhodococcus sp. BP-323]MBY6431764.1 glycosyltransferase family 4 protein [Rhodococcus sp. BP-322]